MNNLPRWDNERIILQFEELWSSDQVPDLTEFLSNLPVPATEDTVAELCRVDLEHRFRRSLESDPGRYLQQFPESFPDENSRRELSDFFDELQTLLPNKNSRFVKAESTISDCSTLVISGDIREGTQVDQYVVVRQIGRGAFSRVYEATDTQLGRNVALKLLLRQSDQHPSQRQRMLREAQAVAILDHAGIVPVYGVGYWQGHDYIASRLVQGKTLDEELAQHELAPRRAAEIARALALSLEHAHQVGIVHRDVKPANIMLESDRPVLLDFGLAHFNDDRHQLTIAGDVLGTPAYMPPEQALGRSFMADGRSDIYSLGVLLYRMIGQRLPFQGNTNQLMSQVIHQDPPPLRRFVKSIDRDLETIVIKCMEKEPSARYPTAELLADDLQLYLDGRSIQARRTSWLGQLVKWARRRPAAAAALLLLGFILAALAGAVSQLRTVRNERDRALVAETSANVARAESQKLLVSTATNAGQLAMQRGNWNSALEHFERALSYPGSAESELTDNGLIAWQRLSTLVSMRRMEQAREVLAELSTTEAAKTGGEAVQFYWAAELELESDSTGKRCEELFEQALQAGLGGANASYAQGMLSTGTEQAIEHFRKALTKNSFHHRARRELVLLLITLAKFEEAHDETRVGRQLFPEDADFPIFQAIMAALQHELPAARQILPAKMLTESDLKRWQSALQFIHEVPQQMQVFPDAIGFNSNQLSKFSQRFSDEILPLFADRGWVFPPRIARLFNGLPALLAAANLLPESDEEVAHTERLIQRLSQLADIHPESTLLLLRSYLDFTRLNISHLELANLSEKQIAGLENMRDGYRSCLDRGFLLDYDREEVWKGVYLASMILAQFAHQDVVENRASLVEAMSHMDTRNPAHAGSIRPYVITLIQAEAYDEAQRWADQWVRVTNRQDFGAYWHLMIIAQRKEDWLTLERLGREGRETFPDEDGLIGFHDHAVGKIRELLDPTPPEPAQSSQPETRADEVIADGKQTAPTIKNAD